MSDDGVEGVRFIFMPVKVAVKKIYNLVSSKCNQNNLWNDLSNFPRRIRIRFSCKKIFSPSFIYIELNNKMANLLQRDCVIWQKPSVIWKFHWNYKVFSKYVGWFLCSECEVYTYDFLCLLSVILKSI